MSSTAYVSTSIVEIEYIYPSLEASEWAFALYWWEGDTKADVHTYDGRIIGQWKYPKASNLDTSEHLTEIFDKFGALSNER